MSFRWTDTSRWLNFSQSFSRWLCVAVEAVYVRIVCLCNPGSLPTSSELAAEEAGLWPCNLHSLGLSGDWSLGNRCCRLLSQEREGKWYRRFPKYPGCCPLYLRNQHSDIQLWEFTSFSNWSKGHTYSRDWGGAQPWTLPRSLSQPVATFPQGLVVTGLHGSNWDWRHYSHELPWNWTLVLTSHNPHPIYWIILVKHKY